MADDKDKQPGWDVQGNPDDKNVQGNRPRDGQGNEGKDIYGNPDNKPFNQ
jgi:hypothetical protein